MASQQDLQASVDAALADPLSFPQFQTNGSTSAFQPLMSSSQVDTTIPPPSVTHVHPQMTTLYPPELDSGHGLSLSSDMSLGSLPSHAPDASAMDVSAAPTDTVAAQASLTDYSSQTATFTLDHINGLDGIDVARLASSPSATTVSSVPSHASSPAVNGVAPSFSTTPSSLVDALNRTDTFQSRTESSGSPPELLSSSSELGFSSTSSGPATSSHDPGFPYPPPYVREGSPEQGTSPHLFTLGTMLKKYVCFSLRGGPPDRILMATFYLPVLRVRRVLPARPATWARRRMRSILLTS